MLFADLIVVRAVRQMINVAAFVAAYCARSRRGVVSCWRRVIPTALLILLLMVEATLLVAFATLPAELLTLLMTLPVSMLLRLELFRDGTHRLLENVSVLVFIGFGRFGSRNFKHVTEFGEKELMIGSFGCAGGCPTLDKACNVWR